jgi:hypothetical protein
MAWIGPSWDSKTAFSDGAGMGLNRLLLPIPSLPEPGSRRAADRLRGEPDARAVLVGMLREGDRNA